MSATDAQDCMIAAGGPAGMIPRPPILPRLTGRLIGIGFRTEQRSGGLLRGSG